MNNYFKIFKNISTKTSKIYNLTNESFFQVLCCRISYSVTPLLIILKLNPNFLTLINFAISILMGIFIIIGTEQYFNFGIIFYLLYRILDFCDGTVARYFSISTFYGRFIDGLADIFLNAFLLFSLSIYSFQLFDNINLLLLGSLASIFTIFDSFIYDKYAALVRWHNAENKKKVLPYIKRSFLPKLPKIYNDIFSSLVFSLLFLDQETIYFLIAIVLIFIFFIISALQTFLVHLYFASINLNFKAKVKNRAKAPKKRKS
jgi:phosphatidylglycerophosphate synthase|tara:strand:+ start:1358 stop:2137 length:780 start_codon:yes stop_codon:yes gene_type:complete